METRPTPRPPVWRLALAGLVLMTVLFVWNNFTPPGWLAKADAIGYAFCHRIAIRSLLFGERPLPLCARCTGMYLGALFTGLLLYAANRSKVYGFPTRAASGLLGLGVIWFGLDGVNSFAILLPGGRYFLYPPNNVTRLLTGLWLGIALAAYLLPVLHSALWRVASDQPMLTGWETLPLLALVGLLAVVVWFAPPELLLFFGLASVLGVLILLALLYSTLLLLVSRKTELAQSWWQASPVLVLGLACAWGQILLIDWLRFQLTGTWAGFF